MLPPPRTFRPELHPEIPPPPALPRAIASEPALSRVAAGALAAAVALVGLWVLITCGWLYGLIAACIVGTCCRFLWWLT
jgi:hypothetical protein